MNEGNCLNGFSIVNRYIAANFRPAKAINSWSKRNAESSGTEAKTETKLNDVSHASNDTDDSQGAWSDENSDEEEKNEYEDDDECKED